MKLRLSLLAASIALATLSAQAAPTLMSAPVPTLAYKQQQELIQQLRSAQGLDEYNSFAVTRQHPGAGETKIVRLAHTHQGLRVWQSESVVVLNKGGKILSRADGERRGALLRAGASLSASEGKLFDTTPKLSSEEAIAIAVKRIAPGGKHMEQPQAELMIYPKTLRQRIPAAANKPEKALSATDLRTVVAGHELVYLVKARMEANGRPALWDLLISAKDGRVVQQISAMHSVVGEGRSQYNGTVPINTTFENGQYKMIDGSRGTGGRFGAMAITNANHTSNAGEVYVNSSNVWGDGQQYIPGGSTTNANGQTAAVSSLWGLMNTYDTLNNVFGWKSLDGQNTATYINVHVNNNYENAYYSDACKCMFIGDGASYFYSLSSIDVIGHEMGHGVTAATSDLTYAGESGGLNESASDIMGDMVEAYARAGGTGTTIPATGNDWEVGREIARNGVALRFMRKPSKDGSSPDAWSSSIGNLDVHYSSGPNNRMFYFLSQGSSADSNSEAYSSFLTGSPAAMSGIGNDKAFRIWFKTLTTKLTASSDYADARAKMIQSAQELYGAGSKEEIAVTRAYAAINVGEDMDEGPTPFRIQSQPQSQSVMFGSNASFNFVVRGGSAPYQIQWYKNGQAVSGATASNWTFAATGADFNSRIHAVARDNAGAVLTSDTATLNVTTSPGDMEVMKNGGFEQGTVNWAGNTGDIGTWSRFPAYEGKVNAWMGGNAAAITENLYQTVTLPVNAARLKLTLQLNILTAETAATPIDKMSITIRDANNNILRTLANYSNLDKSNGYVKREFDITEFKGQTVRVHFTETENVGNATSFVIDAVSLKAN
ncbi:M4 family metallopeptidase [Massilia sp. W12]|uniref:M4 family metallopeptidase n=1 Tax=Massilia sp. W12 TaxID=3126507 RepID=UPI0030D115F1